MALDFDALDDELRSLEKRAQIIKDIKRLAADPEAKAMLEKIVLNGATRNAGEARQENLGLEFQGLSQIDAVRKAIWQRNGSRFVVGELGDELRAAGLEVSNIAVGRVLRRLDSYGEIHVLLEGGGNIPNQYGATETLKRV